MYGEKIDLGKKPYSNFNLQKEDKGKREGAVVLVYKEGENQRRTTTSTITKRRYVMLQY